MCKTLSDEEINAVSALSGQKRYCHLLKQAVDWQQVWGLRSPTGWERVGDDSGAQFIPVWQHERYATAWALGAGVDAEATAIDLSVWLAKWLPGMANDGIGVAVFPVAMDKPQGVVVSPDRLGGDLKSELEKYE